MILWLPQIVKRPAIGQLQHQFFHKSDLRRARVQHVRVVEPLYSDFPHAPNPATVGFGQSWAGDDNVTNMMGATLKHDFNRGWHLSAGVLRETTMPSANCRARRPQRPRVFIAHGALIYNILD